MANDKKKMVEAITAQEVDFAQWYTDICTKAELVEYSSVKGFVVLRPYGYAIWENIQKNLDARFKATGHENVAMPVLIPESLLKKEGELVNGFAPEVAWVTSTKTPLQKDWLSPWQIKTAAIKQARAEKASESRRASTCRTSFHSKAYETASLKQQTAVI